MISLWGCEEVTDLGVTALVSSLKLRSLDLPEFASISDISLRTLSREAPTLESLRLDHLASITDDGIRELRRLGGLQNLTVENCPRVTSPAVAEPQRFLPHCKIIFTP